MAEYKTGVQVNYGFGLSFKASGKAPIIAKQIWATLADAQAYVDSSTDTATAGLILVVAKDDVAANNGVYRVVKAAGEDSNTKGELVKLTEGGDIPDVDALIKAAVEALDAEKSGSDAGTTVKVTETDGKISAVAVSHTKGAIEANNTNLVDGGTVKTYVDNAINNAVASSYKVKGCKDNYTDLPATGNVEGDVWNIKNAFELDGAKYPAGTNVVWVAEHKDGSTTHAAHWDILGGTYDLSIYKEKQDAVLAAGSKRQTVSEITQDANGKIAVTFEDIEINRSQVDGLATELETLGTNIASKLDADTKINGKTLANGDISLTGSDININSNTNKTVADAISELTTDKAYDSVVLKKEQTNTVTSDTIIEISSDVEDQSSVKGLSVQNTEGQVNIYGDRVEVTDGVTTATLNNRGIELGVPEQQVRIQYNDGDNSIFLEQTTTDGTTLDTVRLGGVDTPTDNHDAANKLYVDTKVDAIDTGVVAISNGKDSKTGTVQIISGTVNDQKDSGILQVVVDDTNNGFKIKASSSLTKYFMKDYEIGTANQAVAKSDDLATAIGKLEYRIKQNESTLTWGSWE